MTTYVRCSDECEPGRGEGLAATLCIRCYNALCVLCIREPVEEVGAQCASCSYEPYVDDSDIYEPRHAPCSACSGLGYI